MKNLKTYEGFKDFFRKRKKQKEEIPVNSEDPKESILKYEDDIKYYVNDFEDISFYNEKTSDNESIIYSFFIKNIENKKEEIDMYIEEIKSISNSTGIIFYSINNYDLNISISFKHSQEKVSCFLLVFAIPSNISSKGLTYDSLLRYQLNKKCNDIIYTSNPGLVINSFFSSSGAVGMNG